MTRRSAAGFTVVEIIVAMTLTLAVFAITLPFIKAQTRALGVSAGRMDADQLARYAQRAIDVDLRRTTADAGQPLLVHAGPMSIAFTANLLASDTLDPGASEISAGAPTTLTESWRLANAAALPLTARTFPTQDYLAADGTISKNETISYYLTADTVTGRSDIYVLHRQVNARPPVEIVRGLQVPTDSAFFSYHRPIAGVLTRIAASRLPLYWDSVAVDSVRAVGLRVAGYFRDKATGAVTIRTVQWTTMLSNTAARTAGTCGAAPAAPSSPATVKATTSPAKLRVRFTWNAATDDGAGAGDVRAYVVEWQKVGDLAWKTIGSVAATRASTYEWQHHVPLVSGSYQYAVTAIDCGGTGSTRATATALTLP
ncbi:MAG: fibronectin type III domain-containing protein [Gemmatimonadetes bacterium]|nr:fibronectin type III domain-containing protein [Gemmatimonadota bacterium]